MIKFAGLKAKTYAYFVDDDDSKHKKAKGTKMDSEQKHMHTSWMMMIANIKKPREQRSA